MFKKVTGTKDILPPEVTAWQEIESISRKVFSLYGYQEIRTPVMEEVSLFRRSLGDSAEIVQKQMFIIERNNEALALRPEGTASIVRAYIENSLDKTSGFGKFYYLGPMFRRERPQKGRLRQFHHVGCEAIGSLDADLDVEVIALSDALLRALSIDGYVLKLNSLGCPKDKNALSVSLRKLLENKHGKLCADCHLRLKNNPLRILDCKVQACREVVQSLPLHDSYLCPECLAHFKRVKNGLEALGISYVSTAALVRGLDYYTQTVFEITHPSLGAQDAIGAGGRYNNLVKELGGPEMGAIGFAFGIERLLLAYGRNAEVAGSGLVFVIALGEEARKESLCLLYQLRKSGISCDTDYQGKSLKGALRKAGDINARFVVIIGEDELKKKSVTLKNMASGKQEEVPRESLVAQIKSLI